MVGALGKALARAGHEARIVTPLYRGIREQFPAMRRVDWQFDLPLGARQVQAELWSLEVEKGLTIYFIDQPEFYQRAGHLSGEQHQLPGQRRAVHFFLKVRRASGALSAVAAGRRSRPRLAGGAGAGIDAAPAAREGWGNPPPTCLTIHNLAYQGIFPAAAFALTNLPEEFFTMEGAEFYEQLNCLKAGIAFADAITTVSPRYAREITTEEFGCGLDGLLRRRQDRLFGILNGVDYEEWNTTARSVSHTSVFRDAAGGQAEEQDRIAKGTGLAGGGGHTAVRHHYAAGGTKRRGHPTGRARGNVERGHPVRSARQRLAGL